MLVPRESRRALQQLWQLGSKQRRATTATTPSVSPCSCFSSLCPSSSLSTSASSPSAAITTTFTTTAAAATTTTFTATFTTITTTTAHCRGRRHDSPSAPPVARSSAQYAAQQREDVLQHYPRAQRSCHPVQRAHAHGAKVGEVVVAELPAG